MVTTSYAYLGGSAQVSSLTVGGSASYSSIDAIGNRLGYGGAYLVPDLHGNVACVLGGGSSPAFLNAYRYDPESGCA